MSSLLQNLIYSADLHVIYVNKEFWTQMDINYNKQGMSMGLIALNWL